MRFIDLIGTIDELRQAAEDECEAAGLIPMLHKYDRIEWAAADLLEHLRLALVRIAQGDELPREIAAKAIREIQDR